MRGREHRLVAYEYAKEVGIVTGGKRIETTRRARRIRSRRVIIRARRLRRPCPRSAQAPEPRRGHVRAPEDPRWSASRRVQVRLRHREGELYNNGPVSSYAGDIYEEFYTYADGVFRESKDSKTRPQITEGT